MYQDPQEVASASHCLHTSLHPYLHDPIYMYNLQAFQLIVLARYLLGVTQYFCICSGKGQSIMLAIGGATESLYAGPGTMDLVLCRRKGFVRVALQTGASLVPVINFGENKVYSTIRGNPNSGLRKFQM